MPLDPEALEQDLRRLVARGEHDEADGGLLARLNDVVSACVDLFAVTGSGIMLADETNVIRYVAASDGQARILEKAEAETMQGPCTEAFVYGEVVATSDVRAETRWPAFQEAMFDTPEVRAVLGVPIKLGAVPVGTLDVFRDAPHEWTPEERTAIVRYGTVVQSNLSAALNARSAGEQAAQLQYALDYRVVIERGVGYLMARDSLDGLAAFNRLRDAARSSRTKIGQVAQHLLDTGELPGRP